MQTTTKVKPGKVTLGWTQGADGYTRKVMEFTTAMTLSAVDREVSAISRSWPPGEWLVIETIEAVPPSAPGWSPGFRVTITRWDNLD